MTRVMGHLSPSTRPSRTTSVLSSTYALGSLQGYQERVRAHLIICCPKAMCEDQSIRPSTLRRTPTPLLCSTPALRSVHFRRL